jgi:hypothetical protein
MSHPRVVETLNFYNDRLRPACTAAHAQAAAPNYPLFGTKHLPGDIGYGAWTVAQSSADSNRHGRRNDMALNECDLKVRNGSVALLQPRSLELRSSVAALVIAAQALFVDGMLDPPAITCDAERTPFREVTRRHNECYQVRQPDVQNGYHSFHAKGCSTAD